MFCAEWSKGELMSQKDDDFTLQQRAKTKAGVPSLCCPQSLNTESEIRHRQTFVGNHFVVFTVSFLHKVWLELILLSRLREEREQRKNAPGSESDRTALPSETAPGCRVKVFWSFTTQDAFYCRTSLRTLEEVFPSYLLLHFFKKARRNVFFI